MKNEYEFLKLWTHPDSYFGATWEGYYSAGVGQHRDSDCLSRANFDAMVSLLDEVDTEREYRIVRENHWAAGMVASLYAKGIKARQDRSGFVLDTTAENCN